MTKTNSALMGLIYLMFNLSLFFNGTLMKKNIKNFEFFAPLREI